MSKFRVHIYRTYREVYETDQDTADAAMEHVVTNFHNMYCVESEEADELTDWVLVDPILDDGEVDYEASEWMRWTNTEESYEPLQKLTAAMGAILARYNGEFDNPELMAYGPLTGDTAADMGFIAESAMKEIK